MLWYYSLSSLYIFLALNVQLIYSLYACDFSGEQWSRESTVISQCWLQEQSSKMGRFEWWQWIWGRYWCHSVSITQVIKSLLFPEVQAKRRWQFWCEWCLSWTYSYLKSLHTCNLQRDNVETSKSKSTFLAIFSSNIYIIGYKIKHQTSNFNVYEWMIQFLICMYRWHGNNVSWLSDEKTWVTLTIKLNYTWE